MEGEQAGGGPRAGRVLGTLPYFLSVPPHCSPRCTSSFLWDVRRGGGGVVKWGGAGGVLRHILSGGSAKGHPCLSQLRAMRGDGGPKARLAPLPQAANVSGL